MKVKIKNISGSRITLRKPNIAIAPFSSAEPVQDFDIKKAEFDALKAAISKRPALSLVTEEVAPAEPEKEPEQPEAPAEPEKEPEQQGDADKQLDIEEQQDAPEKELTPQQKAAETRKRNKAAEEKAKEAAK